MIEIILFARGGKRESHELPEGSTEKDVQYVIQTLRQSGATDFQRSAKPSPQPVHNPEDDECA
jgi:hypothetical protein